LAGRALYLDIEGGPPLPIVCGGAVQAMPGLAGREIVEMAIRVKGGEGGVEVLPVLGHEMTAGKFGKLRVHGIPPIMLEY
jgi:hypothetical protein